MAAAIPPPAALNAPPDWALARVPGLEHGAAAQRIERLGGGTVNEVYRVDSAAGRFVLRLDGAAWRRPGVDRARELILHRAAAAAGIAPALVAAAPESQGLLVMEFLAGRLWDIADYGNVDALRRLGERLYALHRLPAPAIETFDPWRVAQAYVRQIDGAQADALERPLQRLQLRCAELRSGCAAMTVVHGDLWQGNLLQGSRLWLLDWEYAQLSDPLMDVACVLAYYPAAERYRAELAAAAGFDAQALGPALSARVFIYRALSWLWHLARGEQAEPP
ncbi:MAG TPA: phosphotransferase [Steroidobacteraceae bacterium]|jgi:thiamine kinase|nr:phosphotransferase [Steroidobacteraceae bacterium]